jgi:penicillin-binding protein-related factor A (putative recombinase)
MKQTANELTQKILDFLYRQGAYAFRVNTTGVPDAVRGRPRAAAKKGISDILAVYKSRFIAIEVKVGKDQLRPEQIGFLKNIDHYGGFALVAKDFETFQKNWLDFSTTIPHTESTRAVD